MEATKKIWMDGTFVDWDNAQVHVLSHTLHYGLGVFEGIRCYDTAAGPAIFRLPEHIDACSTRRTSRDLKCRSTVRRLAKPSSTP